MRRRRHLIQVSECVQDKKAAAAGSERLKVQDRSHGRDARVTDSAVRDTHRPARAGDSAGQTTYEVIEKVPEYWERE
jgi:hypothetical protein